MDKQQDFYSLEKNITGLKDQIGELKESGDNDAASQKKIGELRKEIKKEWKEILPGLTPHHYVQIARHPQRPYTQDYIDHLFVDFMEFHGDRRAGDDPAIVAGFGFYRGIATAVIGHQKGRSTRERLYRNFGQPNPEGYRKALRVMKLAEKFGCPVITLVDTQGAYPGIQAEERGQAEAIAFNLKEISTLKVPVVNIVIGEGGSGGALAIGVGDSILMLQYSFYSVISPEGCVAILWKDKGTVSQAAENLKFLAEDLKGFGVIEEIIPEPPGGAHVDHETTYKNVDEVLHRILTKVSKKPVEKMLEDRYNKFRKIGIFEQT